MVNCWCFVALKFIERNFIYSFFCRKRISLRGGRIYSSGIIIHFFLTTEISYFRTTLKSSENLFWSFANWKQTNEGAHSNVQLIIKYLLQMCLISERRINKCLINWIICNFLMKFQKIYRTLQKVLSEIFKLNYLDYNFSYFHKKLLS